MKGSRQEQPPAPLEVVGPDRLVLGEGVRIVGGRIILVDILAGRLLEVEPGNRPEPLLRELGRVERPLGAVAPLAGRPDAWIAAVGDGIAVLEPPDQLTWLAHLEAESPGNMRMNDAVADPGGRFFAGSMDQAGMPEAGRLWRLDPDRSVSVVMDGITIPNGPAFDRERQVAYLADSAKGSIWRMAVDPASGALGKPHEFVRVDSGEGSPDGMIVDDAGRLWVALWGAKRVVCFDSDGTLLRTISIPAQQPSSVAITPSAPGWLWVTSATVELEHPEPLDGAIFKIPVGVTAHAADTVRLQGLSEKPSRE